MGCIELLIHHYFQATYVWHELLAKSGNAETVN